MTKFLKIVSVATIATFLGTAAFAASYHNPDFTRKLAHPSTYKFNKNLSESICGANQLQHVSEYDGSRGQPVEFVSKYEQSVGALAYGNPTSSSKYCTGTLISEDLFLTAGHCIDSGILKEFAVFNFQKMRGTTDLAAQEHIKIVEVVEQALGGLDFAIIRLEGKPGLKYGFTKINTADVSDAHVLTIIQHPSGRPKMVDVGRKNGTRGENYMTYGDLDTEPGSSGSGVINENGELVGVHTNGGCTPTAGANAGVMMTKIVKASPTVRSLTQ